MSKQINITERLSYYTERLNEYFSNLQIAFERDNDSTPKIIEFEVLNEFYLLLGSTNYLNKFFDNQHDMNLHELNQFIGKAEKMLKHLEKSLNDLTAYYDRKTNGE